MNYKVGKDKFGEPITGGPNIAKIENTLTTDNISYLVIENNRIVGKHSGYNPIH